VRAPAPALGSYLAEDVKKHWRFAPPAKKTVYLQPFNYDFSATTADVLTPAATEPEAEPAKKPDLMVNNAADEENEDALPSPELPTAGAMKKSSKVQIDPQVLKVLSESQPAFRQCGEEKAVVRMSFVIAESGAVSRAHVRSSTVDDEDFERCVLATLSK